MMKYSLFTQGEEINEIYDIKDENRDLIELMNFKYYQYK